MTIMLCILSDGANGSSSTSTSGATGQGGLLGPNIVMGAFSMPVDVVGATQVNLVHVVLTCLLPF